MDPRDQLTQLIAMRGNMPAGADAPAPNFVPPDWWQGGGPQQGAAPQLPPGLIEQFMQQQPPPPQGGFSLEGRSRMPGVFGSQEFEGAPPPGIIPSMPPPPPQQIGPPMELTDEQKRMMERMIGGAGHKEQERIPPRNYGKGQLI